MAGLFAMSATAEFNASAMADVAMRRIRSAITRSANKRLREMGLTPAAKPKRVKPAQQLTLPEVA